MTGAYDKDPSCKASELQLLDDQTGHDGLASPWVIGNQEPDSGELKHIAVHGLDLMGERVHLGDIHGKEGVVHGCKSIPLGLKGQKYLPGFFGKNGFDLGDGESFKLLAGNDLVYMIP